MKKKYFIYLFIFLVNLTLLKVVNSTWTEETVLTVDSPTTNEYLGVGVDLSGSYAILGPYFNTSKTAYFFETDGSTWSQMDSVTTNTATGYFGENVGISGDYALVSDYNDIQNGGQSGAVFAYKRNGSSWDEIQKFGASDYHNTDFFGDELSMVDNYAVIGAYRNDYDTLGQNYLSEAGAAYIFSRTGDVWTEEQKIAPTSSDRGAADWFGRSLDITEDGNYVVVSAYNDDDTIAGSGSVFVFHRENSVWIQTAKLHASVPASNEYFGRSVSIADSGDYIIVGADGNDNNGNNAGIAYIFSRSGSTWTQQAMVTSTDIAVSDYFGNVVSMSSDGGYATVATSYKDGYNGAVYVFSRSGSTWTQTEKLTSSSATVTSFGWDIQLDKANDKLIVGAPDYTTSTFSSAGGAYILSMASAPTAPVLNTVISASSSVSLSWNAVDGASYYTVSSTAASSETTFETSYVWSSGITPNTEYNFQISATNGSDQEGEYSNTTSTYTNPAKPLSLTAVANGQTSANLTWSANNNPTSTVYKIYQGSTLKGSTTSTSYTVTGLSSATTYSFTVRAMYNVDNTSYVESDVSNNVNTDALSNSVTLTLKADGSDPDYKFLSVKDQEHVVEVVAIQEIEGVNKVTLEIHSNPVTVTLASGQSQNVDTSGNGSNDTIVTVNSINETTGEVNFTLTHISQGGGMIIQNPPKVINSSGRAVIINEDIKTTLKKVVKLELDISNATQMAISNDPNFINTSFEEYANSKEWILGEGNGTKIVYVKFRAPDGSTIVYSDTIELLGQSTDDTTAQPVSSPEETTTKTNPNNCSLTPNTPYKTIKSNVVYYITNDCTKQVISNEKNYFSYFNNWNEVKTITETELNKLTTDQNKNTAWGPKYDPKYGALVKTLNDPKVYLLLNDSKYWITNEKVFATLRYSWNWIEQVSQSLLDKYLTKEEITSTTTHPNYTLIKYNNNPKVYRLEPDTTDNTKQVKRHIPNETEFNKLNFRFDRVVTVPDTETYSDGGELKS